MAATSVQHGDLPSEILQVLSQNEPILSSEAFPNEKSTDVKSALDRLGSRSMITYDTIDREEAILEPEAVEIEANGSHEARVFDALSKAVDGLTVDELIKAVGDKKVVGLGQGKAFKTKWIGKGKEGKLVATVSRCIIPGEISLIRVIGQLNSRYYSRATSSHTKDENASRS